jgi:hypothetical protein
MPVPTQMVAAGLAPFSEASYFAKDVNTLDG